MDTDVQFHGGFVVIDGEKWWSEGALQASENWAAQEERYAIVKWLRESVASGPASEIADQIAFGCHRSTE